MDTSESVISDKEAAFGRLQELISDSIPEGFSFGELYKMPSWFVSLEDYPAGYHCQPGHPLPFLSVACTKSHIALYHMGIYAEENLYNWFVHEYKQRTGRNPDMGKSCIRFKKPEQIPYDLIGELVSRMNPAEWIRIYEAAFVKKG